MSSFTRGEILISALQAAPFDGPVGPVDTATIGWDEVIFREEVVGLLMASASGARLHLGRGTA